MEHVIVQAPMSNAPAVIIENIHSTQNEVEDKVGSLLTMEDVASMGDISLELDSSEGEGASAIDIVDSMDEHTVTTVTRGSVAAIRTCDRRPSG